MTQPPRPINRKVSRRGFMRSLAGASLLMPAMLSDLIPPEYAGWWRITETRTWGAKGLDVLGLAMISLTGSPPRPSASSSST